MSIQIAKENLAKVEKEFYDLCEKGRTTYVSSEELSKNLADYRVASEKVWDEMFKSIVDTGVKYLPKSK